MRAPIFYDSNNTGYYVDPASTSVLSRLQIHNSKILTETNASGNSVEMYFRPDDNGTYVWRHIYGGTGTGFGVGAGGYGIYYSGAADYNVIYYSDGRAEFSYSARAPIFYDKNNTAYYVDGNSTSVLNNVRITTLGVGTAATGTGGEIVATNNITAYYSDERLKTKLGPIENPIEKVKSLSGFYFSPNDTAMALGYKKTVDVGVSAQQVKEILPEIIAPAPIDPQYMTVRYEKLIPLLIEAIKEQQGQIDDLKNQISTLLSKNG
jgi:hypothetical protein